MTIASPERVAAPPQTVLVAPAEGAGAFFPATASGQPLALAGFGLTLGLLSLANAGWIDLSALGIIVPVAFSYGSVALILGGVWDFRADNLFGSMWAVSYGCFWLSVALLLAFFAPGVVKSAGANNFGDAFGAYLLLWAGFTAYMTVGSWFIAKPAFAAFALTTVVFTALGLSNILSGGIVETLRTTGGYLGILDAAVAWYLSAALMLLQTTGRQLLPVWPYSPKA
jgi:uncharacterized protein